MDSPLRVGGPERIPRAGEERVKVVPGTNKAGMVKVRTHPATDDFGVP